MNSPIKADLLTPQIVQAIEALYESAPAAADVRAGIQRIIASPDCHDFLNLAELFKRGLERPAKPMLVCCREHSPVAVALCLNLGTTGEVLNRLLAGNIDQADFEQITSAIGKCGGADVWFCEARNPAEFLDELTAVQHDIELVLCDWKLNAAEIAGASALVADQGTKVTGPLNKLALDSLLSAPSTPELEAARAQRRRRKLECSIKILEQYQHVADRRLNDGVTTKFNASRVPEADILALGGKLDSVDKLPAPFAGWSYAWLSGQGAIRFYLFKDNQKIMANAIAVDKQAGTEAWTWLLNTCDRYQTGCPDLVKPGVNLACPPVPFLATLILPPGRRASDADDAQLAFRLRDAVAALIIMSGMVQQTGT